MKDHIEIGHLTKYDASRVNRDQAMDPEILFKIHTNVSKFEKASPKTRCQNHINFLSVLSCTYYLKEAEMKIAMFVHFKVCHGNHNNFKP